ncbi:hypothetical protein THAOC_36354, partial [Thalassiosira oceanica]
MERATGRRRSKRLALSGFSQLMVGDFGYTNAWGCFSKNGIAYWGTGGSDSQIAEAPQGGARARIYCDIVPIGLDPTLSPTLLPTSSPSTSSPSINPTL